MSLYNLQKFLFDINRNQLMQQRFLDNRQAAADSYSLTTEERDALVTGDVGLIYVLGANGQLLMHFAALLGMEWSVYISSMREGVAKYGPVRAGIYSMTTALNEKVANV